MYATIAMALVVAGLRVESIQWSENLAGGAGPSEGATYTRAIVRSSGELLLLDRGTLKVWTKSLGDHELGLLQKIVSPTPTQVTHSICPEEPRQQIEIRFLGGQRRMYTTCGTVVEGPQAITIQQMNSDPESAPFMLATIRLLMDVGRKGRLINPAGYIVRLGTNCVPETECRATSSECAVPKTWRNHARGRWEYVLPGDDAEIATWHSRCGNAIERDGLEYVADVFPRFPDDSDDLRK